MLPPIPQMWIKSKNDGSIDRYNDDIYEDGDRDDDWDDGYDEDWDDVMGQSVNC